MDEVARILCVDDEPLVLYALERMLSERFEVVTATSGEAALELLDTQGPFNVIISDMRMPGMNGAAFLARARGRSPDTVRILLTGHADLESALAAVNDGAIYRFLTKPYDPDSLMEALEAALAQHWFIHAERELLESGVSAVTRTLMELMTRGAPWAAERARFAEACVRFALSKLRWREAWIYEVAAALSQIGCVGLPKEAVLAHFAGRELPPEEARVVVDHPEIAWRMLHRIPNFERVADIVRYQAKEPPTGAATEIVRGADLLRAALACERLAVLGVPDDCTIDELSDIRPPLAQSTIDALRSWRHDMANERAAYIDDLMPGWLTDEDVRTYNGLLVMPRGHVLQDSSIAALQQLFAAGSVGEPIRVRLRPVQRPAAARIAAQ